MRSLTSVGIVLSAAAAIASAAPNVAPLRPFAGPTTRGAVDASTLDGKVLCGYQGWFNTPADGAHRGWGHWAEHGDRPLADGNVHVDVWPDVSEFGAGELAPTGLKYPDATPAKLFSSANRATAMRHFRWMRDYGIDGAFVQRFASQLRDPLAEHNVNVVLDNCRAAANASGRVYSVMYDLSGLHAHETSLVIDDWHALRTTARIADDPAYLHVHGKPLVTIWGVGFNDDRAYTLDECGTLIDALKADGCAVMVGVPAYWRTLDRDAVSDRKLLDVIAKADVVSPWTVGRYDSPDAATHYADTAVRDDLAWCAEHKIDYLPVVFPGFSWHNMHAGAAPSEQIPRLGGRFLWQQFANVHAAGIRSAYVAMFDEVDEGTAILKLATTLPSVTQSQFVPLHEVPGDQYLWLSGEGGRLLRGERDATFPTTRP